jgi:hypothetical protein
VHERSCRDGNLNGLYRVGFSCHSFAIIMALIYSQSFFFQKRGTR